MPKTIEALYKEITGITDLSEIKERVNKTKDAVDLTMLFRNPNSTPEIIDEITSKVLSRAESLEEHLSIGGIKGALFAFGRAMKNPRLSDAIAEWRMHWPPGPDTLEGQLVWLRNLLSEIAKDPRVSPATLSRLEEGRKKDLWVLRDNKMVKK